MAKRRCSSDVHGRVLERGVVERGDVPDPHHRDVEDDREGGVGERAEACARGADAARHRAQEHAREAEQEEDRREVEQQQVLDHVHDEDLLAEAVDGGDERDERRSARPPRKHGSRQPGSGERADLARTARKRRT